MVESTAAAMAYGLLVAGKKTVLVFDMGGGTTDISIMTIDDGKYDVQYTAGQSRLGGQFLDELLLKWLKARLPTSISSSLTPQTEQLLLTQCKLCKEALTAEDLYTFDVQEKKIEVTRQQFEAIIDEPLQLVVSTVVDAVQSWHTQQALQSDIQQQQQEHTQQLSDDEYVHVDITSNTAKPSQPVAKPTVGSSNINIDEIVLVGGCSKIPSIQASLLRSCEHLQISRFIGESNKQELCSAVNPMHAVVEGLAIRGAVLSGCIDLLAATGRAGGDQEQDEVLPAAVQRLKNLLMLDCLPTTIGLLTASDDNTSSSDSDKGKFFEPILHKGNRLPCTFSRTFILDNSHLPGNKRRNMVSLDIYEEIEEVVLDINVWSNEAQAQVEVEGGGKENKKIARKYSYHLLRSADVPIDNADAIFDDNKSASSSRQMVTVQFAVNDEGALSYSASYGKQQESDKTSPSSSSSKKQMMVLLIYAVILALLYLCMGYLIKTVEDGKHSIPGGNEELLQGEQEL